MQKRGEERLEIEKKINSAQLFDYMLKQERDKIFAEKLVNKNETVKDVLDQIRQGSASNVNIGELKDDEKKRVEEVLSKIASDNFASTEAANSFVENIMQNNSSKNYKKKETSISSLDNILENVNSQIKELEESRYNCNNAEK